MFLPILSSVYKPPLQRAKVERACLAADEHEIGGCWRQQGSLVVACVIGQCSVEILAKLTPWLFQARGPTSFGLDPKEG